MSKLDHAGLTVQDLDRSIEFYCTVLGCVVEERSVISGAEVETLTGVSGAVIHTADLKLLGGGMLELLQYVPAGDPIKISRLKITNRSGRERRLCCGHRYRRVSRFHDWRRRRPL